MSKQKQTTTNNEDAINAFSSKNLAQILSVEKLILQTESKIFKNQGLLAKQNNFLNKVVMLVGVFSLFSLILTGTIIFQNTINRDSDASSVNLISDINIGGKDYVSQGSGEIVGEYLYTTAHNFSIDQVDFLVENGAGFLSQKVSCTKIAANTKVKYYEGVLQIPLGVLNSEASRSKGVSYPSILRNNPNVEIVNAYSTSFEPNNLI
jgi:hypothetical protein